MALLLVSFSASFLAILFTFNITAGVHAAYYARDSGYGAGVSHLGYFSPPFEGGTVDLSYAEGPVSIISHDGQGFIDFPARFGLVEWLIKMGTCKVALFNCQDFQLAAGDYLNVANVGGSMSRNIKYPGEGILFYQDFRATFSSRLAGGVAGVPGFACIASCVDYTSRNLSAEISSPQDLSACSADHDGNGLFFTSHEGFTKGNYRNDVGRTEFSFDATNCPNGEGMLVCDSLSLARRRKGRCIDTLELKGRNMDNGSVVTATWLDTGRTRTCALPSNNNGANFGPGSRYRTEFVGRLDVFFNERSRGGNSRTRRGFSCAAGCRDPEVPACNQLVVLVLGHEYENVRDALVTVNNNETAQTDESGRVHFYLNEAVAKKVKIDVIDPTEEHYNVYDYEIALDASGRTVVTIALTGVVRVFMKVVSAADGLPPDDVTIDAWNTHGIHCPSGACDLEDNPASGGEVSFFFPSGVRFLTVDIKHKFHQRLENFGVIIPSGSSNVTIECPIVISPTRPLQLSITAVDVNNRPVSHARIRVDQGPEQEADGSGNLIVSLPTPSTPFDVVTVTLEGYDQEDTKYANYPYMVEEGQFADAVKLTLHPIVDVRVNVTGTDSLGRANLGPIEGVSMRFGSAPLYSSEATGEDGLAILRFVNIGGGTDSVVVYDNGVPGYTQIDSGSFNYLATWTFVQVELRLTRTCYPSWNEVAVESLRYVSENTQPTFQLQFTQVVFLQVADFRPKRTCTQPTNDCDTDLSHIQGILDSNPVIDQGFLDGTNDSGYVYVSAVDTAGGSFMFSPGIVSLLDGEGNYLANISTPRAPRYDESNSEWSVGCVDLSTKKFYCLNVIGMGDICPSVIPHMATPHSYA